MPSIGWHKNVVSRPLHVRFACLLALALAAAFPADAAPSNDSALEAQPGLSSPVRPPIALLYHKDPDTRIQTIQALGAAGDLSLIDDLIRAHSVEFYTPVNHAYAAELRRITRDNQARGPGEWKAWLNEQVAAGRLRLDYLPIDVNALPPAQRKEIQGFAFQLGPEHFDVMAAELTNREPGRARAGQPLRWMVANDHRPEVQAFLGGPWLESSLAESGITGQALNGLAYELNHLANPGPVREGINARIRHLLESTNSAVVANALHLLSGVEGYTTRLVVPGAGDQVRKLLDSPEPKVATQARRTLEKIDPLWAAAQVTFEQAFHDLYDTLGQNYPCFAIKGIDWKKAGDELLPRANAARNNEEFGLLCLELVARLEDSHAYLMDGTAKVPRVPFPQWDPGFACLIGEGGQPVIYHVDMGSPAENAGIQPGMIVVSVNGEPVAQYLDQQMQHARKYTGYSSDRYMRYHAAQWLGRQMERGTMVTLEMQLPAGSNQVFTVPATRGVRYLPRLPVPIPGIRDSGDVSWARLTNHIGYIYVRRIGSELLPKLDQAVADLKDVKGLIVDVRGNSGGGFDAPRAHLNFALTGDDGPDRTRFTGPMALLIDARCISAGEGWASWFIAQKRARVFGETTAGASARKTVYTLKNGLFKVQYPVKAYSGFLDRPIERRGLEPDVPLRQNPRDLAAGRDTVLEAAKQFLD